MASPSHQSQQPTYSREADSETLRVRYVALEVQTQPDTFRSARREVMRSEKAYIVGGMFGLEVSADRPSPPPFVQPDSIMLLNARCGIYVVIKWLKPKRIWMPSYMCGSMLQGVAGVPVSFYPVDEDLTVCSLDGLEPGDLAIIIDYFGFPAAPWIFEEAKSRGAWVLEDACQALLTCGLGSRSDFLLFSARKFLGVPDGGILTPLQDPPPGSRHLYEAPHSWVLKSLQASIERREFDHHGRNRQWFSLFQELEHACPVGAFSISEISKLLLQHAIDYAHIAHKRRENYLRLLKRLEDIALFPHLPQGIVPLGFPVRLEKRDRVRQALFAADIYPPVHWPIANLVPDSFRASHRLSRRIITLVCDQRYSLSDMDRTADVILNALA
jgi:hypothetical protein